MSSVLSTDWYALMAISDKDFRDLRDKVNAVSQTQDETVIPALNDIKSSIGQLAFVSQKDHDRDMRDVRKEAKEYTDNLDEKLKPFIEQFKKDTLLVNKGGVKAVNGVFGKVGGILVFALAVGVIALIIFGVFALYPAIKGAVQ